MFHSLLTLTTMTSVVLHALLGCCVHHACCSRHHAESAMVVVEVGCCESDYHGEDHRRSPSLQAAQVFDICGAHPCSDGQGPQPCCDEPDCNFIASQRDYELDFDSLQVGSPLIHDSLLLSSSNLFALRTETHLPPDPYPLQTPLRVQNQVWRL